MKVHLQRMRYVHHKNEFYKQRHTHNLCELAYYVNGYGMLTRDNEKYEYTKGTVHLVYGDVEHDEKNNAESKIMLLYFEMPENFVPQGIYKDDNGAVFSLLRQIRLEMQENLLHKQEMLDSILTQILIILKRKLFPQPSENKNFNHIVRHIDENFQFDIDIHKLAAKSFYSYERFRHVFKEHTGFAPRQYINNKRIDLAKFLISIDPDISLKVVAGECGFSSLSKFSNAFRTKMGMSPTQYKCRAKNNDK